MRNRWLVAAVAVAVLSSGVTGIEPKFFRDDPLTRDPEIEDASGVRTAELSEIYDFAENSFLGAGERADRRAVNINTVDEVPDSSWFTNRASNSWSTDQLVKGPDTGTGPTGTLTIISGKMEGAAPGFTVRDAAGQRYFIKFDPPSNPEMASGAEIISTKFFHAFGYHVPENYLAIVRRESLVIGEGTLIEDDNGRRRQMDDARSGRAAQTRGAAEGRQLSRPGQQGARRQAGRAVPLRRHATRRPKRHLRARAPARASRATRVLRVAEPRRLAQHQQPRHLVSDGGHARSSGITCSTSARRSAAARPRRRAARAGNEFVWESRPTLITMLTLGFYVRPWIKVDYPDIPSLGRIESTYFRPEELETGISEPGVHQRAAGRSASGRPAFSPASPMMVSGPSSERPSTAITKPRLT